MTLPTGCQALPVVLLDPTGSETVVGGSVSIHPNYPDSVRITGYNYSTSETIHADIDSGTTISDNVVEIQIEGRH